MQNTNQIEKEIIEKIKSKIANKEAGYSFNENARHLIKNEILASKLMKADDWHLDYAIERIQEKYQEINKKEATKKINNNIVDNLDLSKEQIRELVLSLRKSLDSIKTMEPFFPSSNFYAQYYFQKNKTDGLHLMAKEMFNHLGILPNGCIINFYDDVKTKFDSPDAAGFYTTIFDKELNRKIEVIYINSKYANDPMKIGAILAHEMMHLFLFRLNIKINNRLENERLTDLATIEMGLSIVILNGMSYSSSWWLTIIMLFLATLYFGHQQESFGYFKPHEYGEEAKKYFDKLNIDTKLALGYIKSDARRFLPHKFLLKVKPATAYIKKDSRINMIFGLIEGIFAIGVSFILYFILWN